MTLDEIYDSAVVPALKLLPPQMTSPRAEVMMLAAGYQESKFKHRWQVIDYAHPEKMGPARSYWMFEKGNWLSRGGVTGVMLHKASRYWLRHLCQERGAVFDASSIWLKLPTDDVLAAGLARLLIFTHSKPLPGIDDTLGAYHYYDSLWRPGKKRPNDWPDSHMVARTFLARKMIRPA
jgi:hypothetical protein